MTTGTCVKAQGLQVADVRGLGSTNSRSQLTKRTAKAPAAGPPRLTDRAARSGPLPTKGIPSNCTPQYPAPFSSTGGLDKGSRVGKIDLIKALLCSPLVNIPAPR